MPPENPTETTPKQSGLLTRLLIKLSLRKDGPSAELDYDGSSNAIKGFLNAIGFAVILWGAIILLWYFGYVAR